MQARRKLKAGRFGAGFPSAHDEGVLNAGGTRCESVVWDFSQDGGAISTISFGRLLPANAMVIGVISQELTAVTGATSITLKAGSTALTGAIDFTGDAGIQSRALAGSAAGILISAASELNIAIATAAATAGKIRFYVRYLLPNE